MLKDAGDDESDKCVLPVWHDQCPSCGRDDSARCIGPHICCYENQYCEYDTSVCHKENLLPTPCALPRWPTCGPQSLCVTPTLCCDDGMVSRSLCSLTTPKEEGKAIQHLYSATICIPQMQRRCTSHTRRAYSL